MKGTDFIIRLWHSPTFTTWGSLVTRLLSVILVLPLVLVKFAPEDVVVWQLFATLSTLLLLLDFGLAPTFSRMLSYASGGARLADFANMRTASEHVHTGRNLATARAVFATLRWLYLRCALMAMVLLAIGGTVTLIRPIEHMANASEAWLAWGVVVLTSVGAIWGNVYGASLQGLNQVAVMRRWEILASAGQIASSFLVLVLGGGLLELTLSSQAWLVFNVWRLRRLLYKTEPEFITVVPYKETNVFNALWPAAWRSGLGMLMSNGIIQFSGVLYSQVAPAKEVAAYLLALRIITVITQFSAAPFYSKLPKLSELQARRQTSEQLEIARRGMLLSLWVFSLGAVAVMMGVPLALKLSGSQLEFVSPSFWCVMSLAFFIERIGAMHIQLYSLTNHIIWHIANGVTGVLLLCFGVLAYRLIGEIGLPMVMLAVYGGFYCIYAIRHSSREFDFNVKDFLVSTAVGPLVLLCTVSAIMILQA